MVWRNIFHASGSFVPLAYIHCGRDYALLFALLTFCLISVVELLRIKGVLKVKILDSLIKEKERYRPSGSFFFVLSCVLVILIFEEKVATASLLVLSFSDPFAALIGKNFGKIRFRGKSIEGSLGFLFVTFLIFSFYGESLSKAVIVSFISTLTEFFSVDVDDNLSVPLITALAAQLISF